MGRKQKWYGKWWERPVWGAPVDQWLALAGIVILAVVATVAAMP